jgi:hypothetical protein
VWRLSSWLRRLRSVEIERDWLAEELEDAALFRGRRCQFFEAFPGEADGVSGARGSPARLRRRCSKPRLLMLRRHATTTAPNFTMISVWDELTNIVAFVGPDPNEPCSTP